MSQSPRLLLVLGIACSILPAPAQACSLDKRTLAPSKLRELALAEIKMATAIIDGEVMRPFIQGKQTAVVRATRVLKGPKRSDFIVGLRDSCSIALSRPGERMRMLLSGGPGVYFLHTDQSNAFHQDQILKSDRRTRWPYVRGVDASAN